MLFILFLLSCKKDEQSCSDGVFTPEKEDKVDCGGVCPPCDQTPPQVSPFLNGDVNGENMSFAIYSLSKSPEFIFQFENDSIHVQLNFGADESLGSHLILATNTTAIYNGTTYSTFDSGNVVFSEVNQTAQHLSGYFQVKLVSNVIVTDTLIITSAEFQQINW